MDEDNYVSVGTKRKHVYIPAGYQLLRDGDKVVDGDMFCNLWTYKWCHVETDDIGEDVRNFDAVIRRVSER